MEDKSVKDGNTSGRIIDDEGSIVSPAASICTRQKKIERSCLMCHQRKIRCDKRSPCSNCVRVDLLCCYPGPERANRQQHNKTTIADVAARVARLERTINVISSNTTREGSSENSASVCAPLVVNISMTKAPLAGSPLDEMLVQDGYSSRYINEGLLSRVLEEEQELQILIGSVNAESDRTMKPPSFNIGGIFSGFNQSMKDTQNYHPSRWHATQLWRAFITNVDPIVKILHIPTIQGAVFAAINNPNYVEEDLNALLFSIYFAATTSLTSNDAANLLGRPKNTSLNNFKQGLEQSLAGANILDMPSIRSLQALTIYITCLRAYNGGRAAWTLNGLVIRSAQSIGLHRDGEKFGLSPFESEMRRRLWYYMCAADIRAPEDHGLALDTSGGTSDPHFPINVDDNELSPDMKEPPRERAKWTEMSFGIAMMETCHVLKNLCQMTSLSKSPSEQSMGQIMDSLKMRMKNLFLDHCDPNIPIQKATRLCTSFMIAKVEFLIAQNNLYRYDAERQASQATDESLVEACRILELILQLQFDDILKGFHWYFASFTQNYLLTYVLWHLSIKPTGLHIDRAWDAVERSLELTDRRDIICDPGWKWTVLRRLRDKAIRIRDSCGSGGIMFNAKLEDIAGMNTSHGDFEDVSNLTLGGDGNWDMNVTDFPEWSDLVGEFSLRGFAGEDYSMSVP